MGQKRKMRMNTSPGRLTYIQIKHVAEKFVKEVHPSLILPIPIEEIIELKLGIKLNTINDSRYAETLII